MLIISSSLISMQKIKKTQLDKTLLYQYLFFESVCNTKHDYKT
jgi:hypothetical protein